MPVPPLRARLVEVVRQVGADHDEVRAEQVEGVGDTVGFGWPDRDGHVAGVSSEDATQERQLHLEGVLVGVRGVREAASPASTRRLHAPVSTPSTPRGVSSQLTVGTARPSQIDEVRRTQHHDPTDAAAQRPRAGRRRTAATGAEYA